MRKPKVLIDFSKYQDSELDQFAQAVETALTGNANFPTPQPTLAALHTAIEEYQTALSDAASGDHTAIAIKDQKRQALEELLQDEAKYIELVADGDVAKMLSSGFKVSKTPTPAGPLPKPTGFTATPKGKGEIQLKCDPEEHARIYQWEYKQAGTEAWTTKQTTAAKILLTELESGKQYIFRIVPIGKSDVREYSDEITSFVL